MTDKEKTQYMRSSLGMVGIAVDNKTAELLWRMYEGVLAKGADFSLRDAAKIETLAFIQEATPPSKPQKPESAKKAITLNDILLSFVNDYWSNDIPGRPSIRSWIGTEGLDNTNLDPVYIISCIKMLMKAYHHWNIKFEHERIYTWIKCELEQTGKREIK